MSSAMNPSGHYSMDLRTIALSEQSLPGNALAGTLVHEMVHLLLDQSLYDSTRVARPWIGEGLACAFAYSAGTAEGRIALVQSPEDRYGVGRAAQARVRRVQQELRNGVGLRLARLLAADNDDFTGAGGLRHYDVAWLLCHYLLYVDRGAHRERLIAAIAADRNDLGIELVEQELLQLEPAWRQWVLSLSARR
jgi:hypothetical protein